MERIAIMGVGSLGTILGAYIAKNRQVDLIDVNKEHVDALNLNGAKVTGTVEMTVPVTAITPGEMTGKYDLVIFLVKQLYNQSAFDQLKPHLHSESIICTLQNGYPEPELIAEFGLDRVLGCTVGWGATWLGPGISELTSEPEHMDFNLGRIDGKITEVVKETQEILAMMCETHVTETLAGSRWAKIITNASFSGMSAALGCTFGDILDNEIAYQYMNYLVNEIICVGVANGIEEMFVGSVDVRKYLEFSNNEERLQRAPVFEKFWRPHQLLRASMLQDLEKGRKCEIDAIDGVVANEGLKAGVKTPFCDEIIRIVKGIEAGNYTYTIKNISLLEKVLEANQY